MSLVRRANTSDVDEIYDICCAVELGDSLNKKGFLLQNYSAHPELKEGLLENIMHDDVFVYDDNKVQGFLIAYTLPRWKQKKGDSLTSDTRYLWDYGALRRLGVDKVSSLESLAIRDRAAVHPSHSGNGVGSQIIEEYSRMLAKMGVKYQLSGVVEGVWLGDEKLDFVNDVSAAYQRRIGAHRVGTTDDFYHKEGTFLGPDALFKDGIYLARTADVLRALCEVSTDNEMSYHQS